MKLLRARLIIPVICVSALVTSCKQELIENPEQYTRIYMPQAVDYPKAVDLIMRDTAQFITFGAAVGGVSDLKNNVDVSFKAKPELVAEFNSKNNTNYAVLPEGSYELSTTQATLQSGQLNTRGLRVKLKTIGGIEPLKDYMIAISIDQASSQILVNDSLRTTFFKIKGIYEDFDSSKWKLLSFTSDESPNIAANVIDGKTNTIWHTQWKAAKPAHPHTIVVDMNEVKSLHGFNFWPAVNTTTGNPRDLTIELSNDGANWQNAGSFTNLSNTFAKQPVYLNAMMQARYFKITITASTGATHFTHPAEISAF